MTATYVLDVKRPLALLQTLVAAFAGEDTALILDGHLDHLDSGQLHDVMVTTYPDAGDIGKAVIPLTADNVNALVRSVLPRTGVVSSIHEILITKAGETLFYAYDNFDPDWLELGNVGPYNKGATVTLSDGEELLDNLIERRVIRRYVAKQPAG